MREQKTSKPNAKAPHPEPMGWYVYLAVMILFNALIWVTPLLAAANSPIAPPIYVAFGFTCHQLDSRSLCYYTQPGHALIGDCLPQNGVFRLGKNDEVTYDGVLGYKIPVCARDVGIYGAMLLGGLIWPFVRKAWSQRWPWIGWLVISLIPVAIDGTTQLVSDIFPTIIQYESSNFLRLWTGLVMGIGLAFFLIPACNAVFNKTKNSVKQESKSKN